MKRGLQPFQTPTDHIRGQDIKRLEGDKQLVIELNINEKMFAFSIDSKHL